MTLADSDRRLLDRCLGQEPQAWNDFVDRYLGLFYSTVRHTAHMRSVLLQPDDVDDCVGDVLAEILEDDVKVLRRFRGRSSLSTYLAVVARRVVVNTLARKKAIERRREARHVVAQVDQPPELRIENEEEVQRLLSLLDGREAELARSFYLESKTYREISQDMGIPENSIGPLLARLRDRLRKAASQA